MLVAGLPELTTTTIGWVKRSLFLDMSEEEATVQFKHTIDKARKQWYRPIDNLFHVFNDNKKEKKQAKKEAEATKEKKSKKKPAKWKVMSHKENNYKESLQLVNHAI